MLRYAKQFASAGLAALLLALAVSSATARSFSTTENNFRGTWAALAFRGEGFEIRCPITVEGSFHGRTIAKGTKNLIGYVTRAIAKNESCTGGNATLLTATLPWHIRYDTFRGALPAITEIRYLIAGESYKIAANTIFGQIECLARSSDANPVEGLMTRNTTTGAVTGLRADESVSIPIIEGSAFCPEQGSFSGTGSAIRLGTTTGITITLI